MNEVTVKKRSLWRPLLEHHCVMVQHYQRWGPPEDVLRHLMMIDFVRKRIEAEEERQRKEYE